MSIYQQFKNLKRKKKILLNMKNYTLIQKKKLHDLYKNIAMEELFIPTSKKDKIIT